MLLPKEGKWASKIIPWGRALLTNSEHTHLFTKKRQVQFYEVRVKNGEY